MWRVCLRRLHKVMRKISHDPSPLEFWKKKKYHGILWKHPQTQKGMWSSSSCTGATQTRTQTRTRLVCWTPNIRRLTHIKTLKHRETLVQQQSFQKKQNLVTCYGDLLSSLWRWCIFCRRPSYSWSKFDGTRKSKRLTSLFKLTKPTTIFVIHVQTGYVLCRRLATVT